MTTRILIAEDEERMRRLLSMLLGNRGHHLELAEDGEAAWELFQKNRPDVILTDLRMPKLSGLELIEKVRKESPDLPIIVMTAFGSIENAVEAMKAGATDYITKPFEEAKLHLAVERALETGELRQENRVLRTELRQRFGFDSIVAESKPMLEVLDQAREVAPSNSTVIVYGESGTGKELVTRAIHEASSRARGPFVAINCAAIPENLLESELFGHEKGAFTGAMEAKRGRFELASGGTLFLDEIGELALTLQSKVLRALEAQEFERVGGLKTIRTDIRFIAATNKNLATMTQEGKFREDLFYRLNVFPVIIPPLRERRGDVIPLVEHFLGRFCREMGKKQPVITPEAEEVLLRHRWDGNVRELQNTIERAVILLKEDVLKPDILQLDTLRRLQSLGKDSSISRFGPSMGPDEKDSGKSDSKVATLDDQGESGLRPFRIPEVGFSLDEHEKTLLKQALSRAKDNKTAAAKLLGLTRATLRYRLEKYDIEQVKKKSADEKKEKESVRKS